MILVWTFERLHQRGEKMTKDAAVVTIHGMGETQPGYSADLVDRLKKALGEDSKRISWQETYYQDLMQQNQEAVWRRMRNRDLDWTRTRRFVLYGFSDAASLASGKELAGSTYERAQIRIANCLDKAYDDLGSTLKPVLIIAQSLGCHVISNYVWDAQSDQPVAGIWRGGEGIGAPAGSTQDQFHRLQSLRCLVTTGCNIPIFVAGNDEIVPFERPTPSFRWYNYYDDDDVLGWPLKPLSPGYRSIVTEDIEVQDGGLTASWNPFSHVNYWTHEES
jgi:hypothetical protein